MNEQRLQAYQNLIQALLECPNGQEMALLQENRALVDADLVQVIAQLANWAKSEGQQELAEILQQLATMAETLLETPFPTAATVNPQQADRALEYWNLIQQLLNCPNGEEPQILQDNSQLLDRGFLQACEAVAEMMAQQGQENGAGFLRDLAAQLATMIAETDNNLQGYASFLLALLQAELEYSGDRQPIYSILRDNLDKLDEEFARVLVNWANAALNDSDADRRDITVALIETLCIHISDFPLGRRIYNIEIAIAGYEIVLRSRENNREKWAQTQNNLAAAYSHRILGEMADNIERAIACYEAALEVYTRPAFPEKWAITQNNLAAAYSHRILGERADNIERAITYYQTALQVRTRQAFPESWAETQNNLAAAYSDRILGEKADNIERAIAGYQAALEVRTRSAFPEKWAMTQNNLANAYKNRILGERADNIERAIAGYQAALEVRTRSAFPEDWAMTQNNLANAYYSRILGERAQNIEQAIACYQAALEVYTRSAFPEKWATTQNNLATAYYSRILGERADNIERAIACYQAALEVRTRLAFPEKWAETQNNLAIAYSNRILGERAQNIERAIACYQAALEVYTRPAFPEDWAMTQNNLATAYKDRVLGERAQNIEQAIACYQAALEVYTRSAFPEQWAMTQNNLATAYSDRILGERAQNIERAIAGCEAALEVYTRQAFPQNHASTLFNLGLAYRDAGNLPKARDAFAAAIDTVEFLRGEIASGEEAKQKLAEEWNNLYQSMVKVCLEMGNDAEAIEYVERSKSRNLVELLANAEIYPKDATEEQKQQLKDLRRRIFSARQLLEQIGVGLAENSSIPQTNSPQNPPSTNASSDENERRNFQRPSTPSNLSLAEIAKQRQLLSNSQQQLDALLNQFKESDREFTLTQRVEPIRFEEICQLIDADTAILEWYISSSGFQTFIVTRDKIEVEQFTYEELSQLEAWKDEYLGDYRQSTWQDALAERLQRLSRILRLDDVVARLPETCQQLILIPYRYLHLLPLHALEGRRQEKTGNLLDLFPAGIRYAPSCQLLQLVQNRKRQQTDSTPLFAIQNPTKDLPYTDLEVDTIKRAFDPHSILTKEEATKTAFQQSLKTLSLAHYLHFSCHGTFNFTSPLLSGLVLADSLEDFTSPSTQILPAETSLENRSAFTLRNGRKAIPERCLTLQEIFATLDLPKCRLVTLSACETGLTNSTKLIDECIGLASGFLYAGSLGVLNSLWCVDDFATAFLMIKFYQNLGYPSQVSVSQALKDAQYWLKTVTPDKFLEWAGKLGLSQNKMEDVSLRLLCYDDDHPFAQPQYWAAFCAIGR